MMFYILLILLTYRILTYAADPRLTSTNSRHRLSKRDLTIKIPTCYTDRRELTALRRRNYEELWVKEVVPWDGMVPRLYEDGTYHDLSFYFQWATPWTRVWVLFYPDMDQEWRQRYFHDDAQDWLVREIKFSVLRVIEECVIKEKLEGYVNYQSHPFHFLVSVGSPSEEILEVYKQLKEDMLTASHLDDILQARPSVQARNRRQMATQHQPPPPITPRPPPASFLIPSWDRPGTPLAAEPESPRPGQASNDPLWPGPSSHQGSLNGHDPSSLDESALLSQAASETWTAWRNGTSGRPLTNGEPKAQNRELQPRGEGPQTTSGGPQTTSGAPQQTGEAQPATGAPQPQDMTRPPASPRPGGQGATLQSFPLPALARPPRYPGAPPSPPSPPRTGAGKAEFPCEAEGYNG